MTHFPRVTWRCVISGNHVKMAFVTTGSKLIGISESDYFFPPHLNKTFTEEKIVKNNGKSVVCVVTMAVVVVRLAQSAR